MNDAPDETPGKTPVTDRVPNVPATDRLTMPSVTDRFTAEQVTDILNQFNIPRQLFLDALTLKVGDTIADRYLIEEGPIGRSGEAELFRCRDGEDGSTVILKLYTYNITPKEDVLDKLLNLDHPDIVRMKGYSTWANRFYEVMEYCEGGNLSDHMPLTEEDLTACLQEIISGLNYCHVQGIIHRDIKPNNLFFRHSGKRDLVIADFGISSVVQYGEKVRITGTYRNLTLDYAAPELLLNKIVSPATDYYALGITLIHLVTGVSPFNGMVDNRAIYTAHITGNVPIPEDISKKFGQLIKGLTQTRPENRWGFRQVLGWLKGEAILTDSGSKWHEDPIWLQNPDSGIGFSYPPYPGYMQARNPTELAAAFEKFDLFRRRISQWAHNFDASLSDRIIEIEENYTDREQLGVMKLRYLLDHTQPFVVGSVALRTIQELAELLQTDDESVLIELEKALWGEFIECWIDAADIVEEKDKLLKEIVSIRTRLANTNRRAALYALLYTLDPRAPLRLTKNHAISSPEGLEELIAKYPELIREVQRLLYGGIFEEWLRASFSEKTEDIDFVARCRKDFSSDEGLGVFALRCYFHPSLPFPFGQYNASTPEELVKLIDYNEDSRKHGVTLLSNSWIRTWLISTGRMKDPLVFDKVVNEHGVSSQRKLEAILHQLNPDLPWPKPVADQQTIDLGKISCESQKTFSITIRNGARGFLAGGISLTGSGMGFSINEQTIEGEPVKVEITARALGLPAGSKQSVNVAVQTNGGALAVPVTYRVSVPLYRMIGRSMLAGAVFGGGMCILRFLYGALSPHLNSSIFSFMSATEVANFKSLERALLTIMISLLLMAVVGGCGYYCLRMLRINRDKNN